MIHIIVGPTGSGKTKAANRLAEYLSCPIINADAFQIYQDMDIGTAKISKDDKSYFRYHLLDIRKPNELYSVKEYQDDFRRCMSSILKEYKDVVVVGGTGLYIRASIYDYIFMEEEISNNDYSSFTNEELYERLVNLDKEEANKIHVNNRKRIIRALDLISASGKNKSDIINSQEHKLIYDDVNIYFINPDRETLYQVINERVDQMIELGLVEEVKSLVAKYQLSTTAKAAIGYKEILDYLAGNSTLEEAIELIKKRSRNYAKRQVTFFKNQFNSKIFPSSNALIKEIIK